MEPFGRGLKFMKIDEIIRHYQEVDRHNRMYGGVDAFAEISKHQALIDNAENQFKGVFGLDAYRSVVFDSRQEWLEKQVGIAGVTGRSLMEDRVFEMQKELDRLAKIGAADRSPIFDLATEANRGILDALRNSAMSVIEKAAPPYDLQSVAGARIKDWVDFQERFAPKMGMEDFLNSHLLGITEKSLLAQSALVNVSIDRIGLGLDVEREVRRAYGSSFMNFSNSYKDLFESYNASQSNIFTLPPSLTELPTFEFFSGVDLVESTLDEIEHGEFQEERDAERGNIQIVVADSLETYLSGIDPDLRNLRIGAKEAFKSNNPDKIRHCVTSLREMVREVMHYLSPDADIKNWSQSTDDFSDGRPTRKARLRYIARHINHGAFTDFVEKDLAATLAAINLFNAGTHQVTSKLTERQLYALITKVETTLLFLFEIGSSGDH